MAKPWAISFLHSKPWLTCRAGYIAERIRIDGGLCEVCRQNLGFIVHHEITLTPENINDPAISLNWDHLSYECKVCHDQHEGHGFHGHPRRRSSLVCIFDEDGNPVAIDPSHEHDRL